MIGSRSRPRDWCSTTPWTSIGPDGERSPGCEGPLGSVHHSALIGRISDTGAPFLVGESVDRTAEQAGRLFLGINDDDLGNNTVRSTRR